MQAQDCKSGRTAVVMMGERFFRIELEPDAMWLSWCSVVCETCGNEQDIGTAQHVIAWHSMAWRRHSMAQHSVAQHTQAGLSAQLTGAAKGGRAGHLPERPRQQGQ